MIGREETEPSQTRVPRGLTKEARELGRGNATLQLQRDVQTLTTSLANLLARFRNDPGGPRRERVWPKNDLTPYHSSSSQDKHSPWGRRRPTRNNEDDLRDMKFDPQILKEP